MRTSAYSDCFMVVNGPEDGTEFPISRGPVSIGREPACTVVLRLDPSVAEQHAIATAMADGYRVRRLGPGRVLVDGKRAGMVLSRIARSGSVVQVGHTRLCVVCAPEGLASRSRGVVSETDFGWALRKGLAGLGAGLHGCARLASAILSRILRHWLTLALVVVVICFLWPAFRYRLLHLLKHGYGWGRYWIYRLTHLFPG